VFVGELHAAIGRALHCVGCVTNGAVRDLPAVEALGFQLFASSVAVSHAYAHIIEFGEPVEIGGLKRKGCGAHHQSSQELFRAALRFARVPQKIRFGDLIHGDRHGVQTIPLEIATQVPAEASKILEEERKLIGFCRSAEFSLEGLSQRLLEGSGCDFAVWGTG
jgi:4-hydroxy-4-methyl-2-oxoglutarate aldolase